MTYNGLVSFSSCCSAAGFTFNWYSNERETEKKEAAFHRVISAPTNAPILFIFCRAWLVLQTDQRAPRLSVYRGCQAEAKSSPPRFRRPLRYWTQTSYTQHTIWYFLFFLLFFTRCPFFIECSALTLTPPSPKCLLRLFVSHPHRCKQRRLSLRISARSERASPSFLASLPPPSHH